MSPPPLRSGSTPTCASSTSLRQRQSSSVPAWDNSRGLGINHSCSSSSSTGKPTGSLDGWTSRSVGSTRRKAPSPGIWPETSVLARWSLRLGSRGANGGSCRVSNGLLPSREYPHLRGNQWDTQFNKRLGSRNESRTRKTAGTYGTGPDFENWGHSLPPATPPLASELPGCVREDSQRATNHSARISGHLR